MKTKNKIPSWAWDTYQAYQLKALQTSEDADDEVLNFILSLIEDEHLPPSEAELNRLIDNHLAGHRQKLRRRNQLIQKYAIHLNSDVVTDVVSLHDVVAAVRAVITEPQWRLLNGLALGQSYYELSCASHMPEGTIKSHVCRARAKLRDTCIVLSA
jgi:DNA-directed RNA polymerase specialized sigma24 family protein